MGIVLSIHLLRLIYLSGDRSPPHKRERLGVRLWALVRLGAPIGIAQGLENAAFTALAGFAALLGTTELATYQLALNTIALLFMVTSGLATATAIQVGLATGRGDRAGRTASAWLGTALEAALMLVAGTAIWLVPGFVVSLYTHEPSLVAMAIPAIAIAALVILPDGLQGVLMGALRGTGDVVVPTFLHLFSFWAVTVPLAWTLGFDQGLAVVGLLEGLAIGLLVASLLLALRLLLVARRPPRRF
jgi:MATE family multidrug resistance protein